MANNNKNVNRIISDQDDDPTAELEVLPEAVSSEIEAERGVEAESGDRTFDFAGLDTDFGDADETVSSLKSELKSRAETTRALQFELEQLRSRWTGLEKEVTALEEVTKNITEELKLAHKKQFHTGELLKKRDNEIESLRSQLSGKEQMLKESARQIEDAKTKEQESVSPEREIKKLRAMESQAQHQDTACASLEKETTGSAEIINALRAKFDAVMKNHRQLSRQNEEANANNSLLVSELKSKKALIEDYERDIGELRKAKTLAESQCTTISASTTRADVNEEPHELALLVSLNGKASSEHPIRTGRLSLGSSPDNDIQIKSGFISRHHAQIVSSSTDSILGDLNSTNGTYVNSKRIMRHALRNGDSITIGKHRFKYVKQNLGTSDHKSDIDGVRIKQ